MSQIFRCVYLLLANSGYSPRRGVDRGGAQTNEVYLYDISDCDTDMLVRCMLYRDTAV